MTGFRTVPADDKVIDDLADPTELSNGFANVNIIAVNANHAFEAHTIR